MFPLPKKVYDTCIYPGCGKPLGAESKDAGYRTCHEHRKCSLCDNEMSAREIEYCHVQYLESVETDESASIDLVHPRCIVTSKKSLTSDPTLSIKQSEYDFLNLIRLMVEPSLDLSLTTNENNAAIQSRRLLESWSGDFDKAYAHLKMLESCVAHISLALAQDKKQLKARADEREKEKFKKAQKQAETSSRPASKAADDEHEVLLAAFMAKNEIKARTVGLKLWRERNKAIQGWMKVGVAEAVAQDMVDNSMDYRKQALALEKGEEKK